MILLTSVILFAPTSSGPLMRVTFNGGDAVPMTVLGPAVTRGGKHDLVAVWRQRELLRPVGGRRDDIGARFSQWCRRRLARISQRGNRQCDDPSGRILIVTSRSSFVSRARKTWPMPPSPMGAVIS